MERVGIARAKEELRVLSEVCVALGGGGDLRAPTASASSNLKVRHIRSLRGGRELEDGRYALRFGSGSGLIFGEGCSHSVWKAECLEAVSS